MDQAAHVRGAVSLINSVNSLLFWLRHLSDNLPTPTTTDTAVYIEFYNIFHQAAYLLDRFSTVLPMTTGLFQITAHPPGDPATAPEGPVAPPPQPPPLPPRDAVGQGSAPEGQALMPSPPPMPCPRPSSSVSAGRGLGAAVDFS